MGTEALNEDNLVCKAILQIKKKYKNEIGIMCDVALDPYTSHGHDGLIKNNEIINDETIEVLVNQSLLQAKIGCDVLAPSDTYGLKSYLSLISAQKQYAWLHVESNPAYGY